nr:hypothetical protein CFP56_52173 [Quercus suber]
MIPGSGKGVAIGTDRQGKANVPILCGRSFRRGAMGSGRAAMPGIRRMRIPIAHVTYGSRILYETDLIICQSREQMHVSYMCCAVTPP